MPPKRKRKAEKPKDSEPPNPPPDQSNGEELTPEELQAMLVDAEEAVPAVVAMRPPQLISKDDVVWIVYVTEGTRMTARGAKMEPVSDSDLERTADDFSGCNEVIGGGLYVVQNPKIKGCKVGVYPVFDRPDKNRNVLEKWQRKFVRPFYNYSLNERIKNAILKSIVQRLATETEYQDYWTELQRQYALAKRYAAVKLLRPTVRAREFLTSDDAERNRYYLSIAISTPAEEENVIDEVVALSDDNNEDDARTASSESPDRSGGDSNPSVITIDLDSESQDVTEAAPPAPPPPPPKEYKYANREIFEFFGTAELQEHLAQVMTGRLRSERHDMFTSGEKVPLGMGGALRLSNTAFLRDDWWFALAINDRIRETVYNGLSHHVDLGCNDPQDYVFHCLLPEGIVYFITKREGVDREEAEELYLRPTVTEEEMRVFDAQPPSPEY